MIDPIIAALAAHCRTNQISVAELSRLSGGLWPKGVQAILDGVQSPHLSTLRTLLAGAGMDLPCEPVPAQLVAERAKVSVDAEALARRAAELDAREAKLRDRENATRDNLTDPDTATARRATARALAGYDAITQHPSCPTVIADLVARARRDVEALMPAAVTA